MHSRPGKDYRHPLATAREAEKVQMPQPRDRQLQPWQKLLLPLSLSQGRLV